MDAEVLLRHQRFLRRLVRGLVGDEEAAEDIEQATWLVALERPPRSPGALRAWLARVARNLSLNRRRAEANEVLRCERAAEQRSWPPADEVASELELAERVLAAVRELPEPLRAAVHARYYDGLGLEEIARRTGVPAETIKDRLERARAILRRRLGRERRGRGLRGAVLVLARRFQGPLAGGLLVKKLVALVVMVLAVALVFRLLQVRREPAVASAGPESPQRAFPPVASEPAIEPMWAEVDRTPLPARDPGTAVDAMALGSLRLSVAYADGTPAERVFARIWPEEEGDFARFPRAATTDPEGSCRISGLAPEPYRVQLEREKDFQRVEVRAGEEARLALTVSAGPRAEGLVVNEHGEPVAGAGVWISTRYASFQDKPIDDSLAAITGPDGRFVIPSVGKAWLIGARAEGYAPSDEKSLTRFRLPTVEVRLVLPERGGAIEGRVLGPAGEPVVGAAITADVGYRFERYPEGGIHVLNSLKLRTFSGGNGSFRFSGVQPGQVELLVSAPEHVTWRWEVEVSAGSTTRVEALLCLGGSVSGRALDADGTPLGGVLVVASIEPRTGPVQLGAPWLEQDWNGLLDVGWERYSATRSRPDGSYRLGGLPAGHSFVVAQTAAGGRMIAPLWIEPGQALERDLVLERGLELRCRLMSERGAPLAGYPVFVARIADEAAGTTSGSRLFRTDEEGRLVVPNCADASYMLDIRHRDAANRHLPCPQGYGLRPGPSEHRIVVSDSDLSFAFVRGIVLDDAGRPLPGARIDLKFADNSSLRVATSGADGSFLSQGFRPGPHGLHVRAPGFPYAALPPRAFAGGETADIGIMRMKTPGFLRARITREDSGPVDSDRVQVRLQPPDGSFWWSGIEIELGEAVFDPIEPGPYTVEASAAGCETVRIPVQVEAGATRELDIHLRRMKVEPR